MTITVNAGQTSEPQTYVRPLRGQEEQPSMTINAKDLHLGSDTESMVAGKKHFAQQQAMKLIADAYKMDEAESKNIQNMKDKIGELNDEVHKRNEKVAFLEERKATLKEEYGIGDDEQQQKDLELLEKYQKNKGGFGYEEFSEEEIARLKELEDTPLSEYQKKALYFDYEKDQLESENWDAKVKMLQLTQNMTDAKIDLNKVNDMGNAEDAAEEILAASNDEILGLLFEDGKKNIDEQEEKREEVQEEKEKEAAEQEEKLKAAREKREEQEEIIEGEIEVSQMEIGLGVSKDETSHVAEAQQHINRLMKQNNLINEDLKGIEIDLGF